MKLINYILLFFTGASVVSLQAQDYLISFTGTGAGNIVDSVRVENLTQSTKLIVNGSNILHLKGVATGIEKLFDNEADEISFYPNPMNDHTRMQFILPESGKTTITLYDLSGRVIAQKMDPLLKGKHTYKVQDIAEGITLVRISTGKHSFSGRLLSAGSAYHSPKIIYENTIPEMEKQNSSKSTNAETVMQYNTGDRLILTGISGIYRTVVSDIPASDKDITFNFVPCTDGAGINYPVVHIGSAKGNTGASDPTNDKGVEVWMAENLKTTKFNNGNDIQLVKNPDDWVTVGNQEVPACCYYNNNPADSAIFGLLYNWYTVNSGNLCPSGWHVPSYDEWTALMLYLIENGYNYDGTTTGGKFAKALASNLYYWSSSTITGAVGNSDFPEKRDATGFTALPGGDRNIAGSYFGLKDNGNWWTSSSYLNYVTESWYIWMYATGTGILRTHRDNRYAHSVRCIKD